MIPTKLKKGDQVRIVSPARSMAIISENGRKVAEKRFKELGLELTYSKHINENDEFRSSRIASRIQDLHEAFSDKDVKAIITTIGGFNSNQLLRYLNYKLIRKNPKILCGYSDITALQNAILAKTGLVTYYGPHFSTFGMVKGFDYTMEYFKRCLFEKKPYSIPSPKEWSDDPWYKDQEKRDFHPNKGYYTINEGVTSGRIVGGNLCTLNLLQGTEYMPSLMNSILFIEDDRESKAVNFDRDLQSLIHLPAFSGVKGIVIGRFQKASEVTETMLRKIIETKKELKGIPVIADADFGHTDQRFTFPIGGSCEIHATKNKAEIRSSNIEF